MSLRHFSALCVLSAALLGTAGGVLAQGHGRMRDRQDFQQQRTERREEMRQRVEERREEKREERQQDRRERMSPEERRQLRQDIDNAGRDIYRRPPPRNR